MQTRDDYRYATNTDVAASTVMQVEVVDCRAFRPEARVANNEAYCRSWRRAVWSAALAKLEANIRHDEAFSLTVVLSGLLDHKHGRGASKANIKAAVTTLTAIDRKAVLTVHDASTFEFEKSSHVKGAHRFSLTKEGEHFRANANAAFRFYVQSAC